MEARVGLEVSTGSTSPVAIDRVGERPVVGWSPTEALRDWRYPHRLIRCLPVAERSAHRVPAHPATAGSAAAQKFATHYRLYPAGFDPNSEPAVRARDRTRWRGTHSRQTAEPQLPSTWPIRDARAALWVGRSAEAPAQSEASTGRLSPRTMNATVDRSTVAATGRAQAIRNSSRTARPSAANANQSDCRAAAAAIREFPHWTRANRGQNVRAGRPSVTRTHQRKLSDGLCRRDSIYRGSEPRSARAAGRSRSINALRRLARAAPLGALSATVSILR
jgi:hypothetical protein